MGKKKMNLGNIMWKFKVGRKIKRAGRCEGFIEDNYPLNFNVPHFGADNQPLLTSLLFSRR